MPAVTHSISYLKSVGDEPLPGYRLIAPLGRGGFGEVWKCIAPGGLQKAIKFVMEDSESANRTNTPLQQEYQAVQRIKEIRHPFLMTLERVELIDGELLMVMELADKSLANRHQEWRQLGQAGIPRSELLSYMVDAAEALDVLSHQFQLQHLDVKPANLFLVGGHAKVGDYGLVDRFENGTGNLKIGRGLTPRYVAPEVISNQVDPRSDQYSLALVYQELLTSTFPYDAPTAEAILVQHMTAEPNLASLPYRDREATRRALSKKPANRFPSCLEYVKALMSHESSKTVSGPTVVNNPTPPSLAPTLPRVSAQSTGYEGEGGVKTILGGAVNAGAKPTNGLTGSNGNLAGIGTGGTNGTTPFSGTMLTVPRPHLTTQPLGSEEVNQAFPNYRFHSVLETTNRGRTIRAIDNIGHMHRVQFVRIGSDTNTDIDPALRAAAATHQNLFQTIAAPHPRVVAFSVPEELTTLHDRLREVQTPDQKMKPAEVCKLLQQIAQTLDELYAKYQCCHLQLSPKTIIVRGTTIGVTGYGIGELLRRTSLESDWLQHEAYAAPEVLLNESSAQSDQYSLALIYLELLHAWTPDPNRRSNRNANPLKSIVQGVLGEQELNAVRKALSAKPADRFESCAAFINALRRQKVTTSCLDEVRFVESLDRLEGNLQVGHLLPTPPEFLESVFQLVNTPTYGSTGATAVRQSDGRWGIRFPVRMTLEMLELKFVVLRDELSLEYLQLNSNTYLFRKASKLSRPGVEMTIQVPAIKNGMVEITVLGRLVGGLELNTKQIPAALIEKLDSLRRCLQNQDERRHAPRFKLDLTVHLYAIDDELNVAAPVIARLRDISTSGMCCTLFEPVVRSHLFVNFPSVAPATRLAILSKVVRTQQLPNGQHLVAVRFPS